MLRLLSLSGLRRGSGQPASRLISSRSTTKLTAFQANFRASKRTLCSAKANTEAEDADENDADYQNMPFIEVDDAGVDLSIFGPQVVPERYRLRADTPTSRLNLLRDLQAGYSYLRRYHYPVYRPFFDNTVAPEDRQNFQETAILRLRAFQAQLMPQSIFCERYAAEYDEAAKELGYAREQVPPDPNKNLEKMAEDAVMFDLFTNPQSPDLVDYIKDKIKIDPSFGFAGVDSKESDEIRASASEKLSEEELIDREDVPRGIQTYSLEELGSSKPLLAARVVQFLADYPELQANVVGGYVNFFYQKKLRELEEQEQQIVLDYPAEHFEEIKELALRKINHAKDPILIQDDNGQEPPPYLADILDPLDQPSLRLVEAMRDDFCKAEIQSYEQMLRHRPTIEFLLDFTSRPQKPHESYLESGMLAGEKEVNVRKRELMQSEFGLSGAASWSEEELHNQIGKLIRKEQILLYFLAYEKDLEMQPMDDDQFSHLITLLNEEFKVKNSDWNRTQTAYFISEQLLDDDKHKLMRQMIDQNLPVDQEIEQLVVKAFGEEGSPPKPYVDFNKLPKWETSDQQNTVFRRETVTETPQELLDEVQLCNSMDELLSEHSSLMRETRNLTKIRDPRLMACKEKNLDIDEVVDYIHGTEAALKSRFLQHKVKEWKMEKKTGLHQFYEDASGRPTFTTPHSNFTLKREYSTSSNAQQLGSVEPRLFVSFACKHCGTRNSKTISKLAYEKGVVLIQCKGCKNRHLIADNLNWFGEGKQNVETILQEKGEEFVRLSEQHLVELIDEMEEDREQHRTQAQAQPQPQEDKDRQ